MERERLQRVPRTPPSSLRRRPSVVVPLPDGDSLKPRGSSSVSFPFGGRTAAAAAAAAAEEEMMMQ